MTPRRREKTPVCARHSGVSTTYPIETKYYNKDMQEVFGGDGMYRKSIAVTYCMNCGELLLVRGREATAKEKALWRETGSATREYWRTLPFMGEDPKEDRVSL